MVNQVGGQIDLSVVLVCDIYDRQVVHKIKAYRTYNNKCSL
jgi:hypothetical protein